MNLPRTPTGSGLDVRAAAARSLVPILTDKGSRRGWTSTA